MSWRNTTRSWKPPFASRRLDAPKPQAGDVPYALVKAAVSSLPLGSLAAELFGLTFAPPFERRQQDWMESVSARLSAVEANGTGLPLAALGASPAFVTLLVTATQAALRTHHEEKLNALRNILVNSASRPDIDSDIRERCIALVDQLAPSQLRMLRSYRDRLSPYGDMVRPHTFDPVENRTVDKGNLAELQQLWKDLERFGLVERDPPPTSNTGVTRNGGYVGRVTLLGKRLLAYVSDARPGGEPAV